MKKYNWTIDTLQSKMVLIEKLIERETDEERLRMLQQDYYTLQNHIDDYFDQSTIQTPKLLESYQYVKEDLTTIPFLWADFQKFSKIVSPIKTPGLKRTNLSRSDLLDITHDFYKSLNGFFFGNFMKNFCRRNDHIVFRSYNEEPFCGETITLPSLKESYIEICREYTAEDILTTVHEYAHATSVSINPSHLFISKSLYTEIDSIFMELIASDYIEQLFRDNSTKIINADKLNEFYNSADDLSIMLKLINAESTTKEGYTNNRVLKQIAKSRCNLEPQIVEDVLNSADMHSTIYLTSYMFAIELYNLYKKDKDKALYYLKKIILLSDLSEEQYYSNIKRFGFIPNLSLPEYYRDCKQDVMRLTRKKSKPRK